MIRALWTSASGLISQQAAVDAISNNVTNINTNGYKKNAVVFQDLFYQRIGSSRELGPEASGETVLSAGTGAKVSSTSKIFNQGRLEQTGNPFDIAVNGEGFFRVTLPDGSAAYTRDGSFKVDSGGRLVTAQGYGLEPSVKIPGGATNVVVHLNGTITANLPGNNTPDEIGRLSLFKVENPGGMIAVGENLFIASNSSGAITEELPDSGGMGKLDQGFIEGSNVELAEEMLQLVVAQRAYQINSRALSSASEMLSIAVNIRS